VKALLYALRAFGRELRSGEVIVLLAAVALAVAALTAVGFLTDRIGRAVERQANEVLAADLRLRTPDPIPAEWHELAADYGLQSAETQTFPSVVFAGDLSSLATIKGVKYAWHGTLRTTTGQGWNNWLRDTAYTAVRMVIGNRGTNLSLQRRRTANALYV